MTDRPGTVRVSPDGKHQAFKRSDDGQYGSYNWTVEPPIPLASGVPIRQAEEDRIAHWKVVHRPSVPPHPVGTVMRREGVLYSGRPFWEVSIRTEDGWRTVSHNEIVYADEPYDDEEGAWEVLHHGV